eukprot:12223524-Heterocapsa_arctica.AAC.1
MCIRDSYGMVKASAYSSFYDSCNDCSCEPLPEEELPAWLEGEMSAPDARTTSMTTVSRVRPE